MILIGTDGGIYRWSEGAGWPVFHSLQDHAITALASPSLGVLVALDGTGQVFESLNNGQDWRVIPMAEGIGKPTTLGAWGHPATIVAGTRSLHLARRPVGAPIPIHREAWGTGEQGGSSGLLSRAWTLAGDATALLTARRRTDTVKADRATASLAGWTRLGSPTAEKGKKKGQASEIQTLAAEEGSPAWWFATVKENGLWRSHDRGANWQQCPGLPSEVNMVRPIAGKPGTVYAATSNGCWLSTDSGQTWEERSGGLDQARSVTTITANPRDPNALLAGAGTPRSDEINAFPLEGVRSSLYESKDGGKTWSLVRRGNPDVLVNDTIADIQHDPNVPEFILMALTSGELWVTRNGGAYWVPLSRQIRAVRTLCPIA